MDKNSMIKNTITIDEKLNTYIKNYDLNSDLKALDEYFDVNTLLTKKYFRQMLKVKNITKEQFAFAISDNDFKVNDSDWYDSFIEIILKNKIDENTYKQTGVLTVIYPFVKELLNILRNIDKNLKNIEVLEEFYKKVTENFNAEMFEIIGKAMAVSLNFFKEDNKELIKEENLFEQFFKQKMSKSSDILRFFEKYPVLSKLVYIRSRYLINNYKEIIKRCDNDYDCLKEGFLLESNVLKTIHLSEGDSHDKAHSVCILEFNDSKKIVYKPKDSKINSQLEKFFSWISKKGKFLDIKLPKTISRDDYSYWEYVEYESCNNELEIINFYKRYGYIIALSYILSLTDLHLENVIAHNQYPVIVDMETLFQGIIEMENSNLAAFKNLESINLDSVYTSCLLPRALTFGKDSKIDLSALEGKGGKLKEKVTAPKDVDTINFRYEKIQGYFQSGDNIPKLRGNLVNPGEFKIIVLMAFKEMMNFFLENKKEVILKLREFSKNKIRVLTKATEKYASMLRYANHPHYLKEMKYKERLFMNLWAYPYKNKEIVDLEIKALLENDIPIFYSYPESVDIFDTRGNKINSFLSISGLDRSIDRLRKLDSKEISRQISLLNISLG